MTIIELISGGAIFFLGVLVCYYQLAQPLKKQIDEERAFHGELRDEIEKSYEEKIKDLKRNKKNKQGRK